MPKQTDPIPNPKPKGPNKRSTRSKQVWTRPEVEALRDSSILFYNQSQPNSLTIKLFPTLFPRNPTKPTDINDRVKDKKRNIIEFFAKSYEPDIFTPDPFSADDVTPWWFAEKNPVVWTKFKLRAGGSMDSKLNVLRTKLLHDMNSSEDDLANLTTNKCITCDWNLHTYSDEDPLTTS